MTSVRCELSGTNKYWISKHRYYELKHFCLQYKEWKKRYCEIDIIAGGTDYSKVKVNTNKTTDYTADVAIQRMSYLEKIQMIEKASMDADDVLYPYILKAVTEGLSYVYLKSSLDIPCGKDLYYDRYRRFFWLLDKLRE